MVHALRLGREYTEPFQGWGKTDKHEISSLCWFQCCLGLALTLGVGQFFTICGNYGVNCAACYTCHSREKFRRCLLFFDASKVLLLLYALSYAPTAGSKRGCWRDLKQCQSSALLGTLDLTIGLCPVQEV
jgi:hypothetical protein